jgi:hypothetical protein
MRRLAITFCLVATTLLGVGLARAEVVQNGNVRISFDASFSPRVLPREEAVPLKVHLQSKVKAVDGGRPPTLKRFVIAINRYGTLSTQGLPICRPGELAQTTTAQARARCRGALVGQGHFDAFLALEQRQPIPVTGRMLLFNSRRGDDPVLLLHVYVSNPVIVTLVLTTHITRSSSPTFGTIFTTTIPQLAAGLGYVTDIDMTLSRRYRYQGKERSFLSASCAAPGGFSGAPFSLAKASFFFLNKQELSQTLVRHCTVR